MPMDFSYPALDGKQGLPVKSFNLGDGFKDWDASVLYMGFQKNVTDRLILKGQS
jgi:hypothetical protein